MLLLMVLLQTVRCYSFLFCLLVVLCACRPTSEDVVPSLREVAPVPANPNLTPAARDLLTLLSRNYGRTTLAGQVEYKEESRYVAVDYIESIAGRRPVILGLDLIDYSPSRRLHGADPGNLIGDALEQVKSRSMVLALTWHWNAPMHLVNDDREPWWRGFYTSATEFNLHYALRNPQSPEYAALLRDIDVIAAELQRLAEADIPVLWRPLHAAEGGWFWWGAKGAEAFKELWRLMFVRLTNHHQLNNLIWVLTSEDPEWYPGDDVVDMVGVDAYPEDRTSILREQWIEMLKQHNARKMIALTEFGGVPPVEDMHSAGVWFSFFITWTDESRAKLGPKSVDPVLLQKVYQSPSVTTLDEWTEIRSGRMPTPAADAASP